uniref:intraflagellar transport protein 52 homolog n=1 Tax=Ciona intestinalis TaxID=7719 RepID=UPI000052353F|nr:intraflagellar transport protein 52 homolog [Ciona intestinalis]|eukprot:XP_002126598.1 intraflagellar transport protein 52 homolog [Ciona intestinalis]
MMPPVPQMGMEERPTRNMILFDQTKRELFTLNNGYKTWHRRLRNSWKVAQHKDEISEESLSEAKLFIVAAPREKFTTFEFENLKRYIDNGGSLLVLLGEGGEGSFNTNINFLLEEYGIMINNDAVVRSVYYKYFHPKEALVSNGVLNRAISRAAGKSLPGLDDGHGVDGGVNPISQALQFVYPYGATLNVVKPSTAVLSTGSACIPVNRPVLATCQPKSTSGKLCVVGSAHMFSDQYMDKEENARVMDVIIRWLTTDEIELDAIDAEDPEISDYNMLPHTEKLSDRLKSCLQEGDDIPTDFTKLFDTKLFKLDNAVLPKILKAFDQLNIKHEPLTLIPPSFETPLPPLQPAVFPPEFCDLPGPPLDLFDLDENFSSEKVRLAQITNKCNDDDLEYYVRECGDILGISPKLPKDGQDAKHILEHVLFQIVEFKKAILAENPEDQFLPE